MALPFPFGAMGIADLAAASYGGDCDINVKV